MLSFFNGESWWMWGVIALLFATFEMFTATTHFMWAGIAAALTGVLAWLLPPEFTLWWQALFFSVLTVGAMFFWYRWAKQHPAQGTVPNLNDRGAAMVGRKARLVEDLTEDGAGAVMLDDTQWRARSESGNSLPAGTRVEVVASDSATLIVKPIQ